MPIELSLDESALTREIQELIGKLMTREASERDRARLRELQELRNQQIRPDISENIKERRRTGFD
ncbi:MAG TPA: hypothetical protein VNZ53_40425 [Steroidobacteraceae bacterium]|jgi:hypothetical protein|nr:hypothetical protein [Steroidobacteraceae bacterium]